MLFLTDLENTEDIDWETGPTTQGRLSMGCTQGVWLLTVQTVWNP